MLAQIPKLVVQVTSADLEIRLSGNHSASNLLLIIPDGADDGISNV